METFAGIYLPLDPFETRLALNERHAIFRDMARRIAREIYGRVELEVWGRLASLRGTLRGDLARSSTFALS